MLRNTILKIVHRIRRKPVKSAIVGVVLAYLLWVLVAASPFLGFGLHPFRLVGGEKNYLVLFQNNYELRPTGGFISAFGILTMKNGFPVSFNFEDVYGTVDDHPYVEPPRPLGLLLAHPTYKGQTFRDANFYPDFSRSAAELETFLHKTRPFQKIDGVFAVDMAFLENWLDAVGKVNVDGTSFDAEHLLEQIENQVSDIDLHDLKALKERKMGVKVLAKKLVIKTFLPWNLPKFFGAVEKSLDEKHAIAFFKDDVLQEKIVNRDWGAVISPKAGEDFLGIVDANYGGAKSNRYVKRTISYYIDLEAGKSTLDVRYDHPGENNIPLSSEYKGYLRAYLPADHTVKSAELQGEEGNLFFAGNIVKVPIRSNKTVHFDFEFPRSIFDSLTYRLNLWKQPGTYADLYNISIRVPTGMRMESDDFNVTENIATFRGFLDKDMTLSFVLDKDAFAPRVISQELKQLNMLEMYWNEPIAPSSLESDQWDVKDSDVQNSKTTDKVFIKSVELDGTRLRIYTIGMTPQPEERYILEISGVGDYSGNATAKRTYTFFQRME